MSSSSASAPGGVQTQLTFIVPQEEKPYFESAALTGTVPKVHYQTERLPVTVQSMRPLVDELSLDEHGFELMESPTDVVDLYDDDALNTEICELTNEPQI